MYITPNSNIWILHGCPLDAGYEQTIIFDSAANQRAWFTEFEKIALAGYSYQRVNANTLRVGLPAAQLYDSNYMIFQNTTYSNKYWYAFIEKVNYINDNVTEIIYNIDVMQSFLFDYTLGESFIERQHAEADEIGGNTVPENLEVGEYLCENANVTTDPDFALLASCSPVFISSVDLTKPEFPQYYGRYIDGLFSGCSLYYFTGFSRITGLPPAEMVSTLQSLDAAGKGSALLGIIMLPTSMLPNNDLSNKWVEITALTGIKYTINGVYTQAIDGYTPKNNKCFTSPFYKLVVSNNSGKSQEFAIELFKNFEFAGKMAASPATPFLIYPTNYAGKSIECALPMDAPAQCTWNNDTYKNWLAQNQNTLIVNTISAALGATVAAVNPANIPGAALSLVTNIAGTLAQLKDRQAVPLATNGTIAGASFLVSQGFYKPTFLIAHPRAEFVRIIDEYFTRFGYSVHRVTVPNREAREHFTFLKTTNANIKGIFESGDIQASVPAEVETQLKNIYNAGVTIWRNVTGGEMGNYSISNKPITEVNA